MKRVWKKLLPPVFAVLLIAPTAFFAYPNKSDAIVGCLAGYLFNQGVDLITDTAKSFHKISTYDEAVAAHASKTKANTQGSLLKECILDITAKQIARAVLQSFTKSVVNWINSGFEGKPSFVTNPTGFLMDVADREFGREIRKIAPILCSPFRLNLQFALGLQYSLNTKEEVGCRLSDVIANARGSYDSFVGGDFRSGGWRNWVTVTNTPQNNIYGAYLGAVGRLDASIISATGEEVKLLDFGQGFKSWRSCDERAPDEKDKNGKVLRRGECTKPGKIKTPGSILMEQTSGTLQSSLRELEVADEIDEIFGALVNQLLIRTLGPGGLLGNSEPEPGGGPSYLDQLINSPENAELLASIRPPEGINCNEEYEASGSADPVEQHRVMKVTYGRTNGKVKEIIAPNTTVTPPVVPPVGVIQVLRVEVWRGDALTSVGAATGLVHTVENRGTALAVGDIVSFERFEGPETVFVGVQTIRLPDGAFHWNGTTYDTTRKLYRPAGKSWAEYFQQVRQGCRNQINLYAEQINNAKTNEAATASGAAPATGGPPPVPTAQSVTGNIAQGKKAEQADFICSNFGNNEDAAVVNDPYASAAVDGQRTSFSFACTTGSYWRVDLETDGRSDTHDWTVNEISKVIIYPLSGGWKASEDENKKGRYFNTLRHGSFDVEILSTAPSAGQPAQLVKTLGPYTYANIKDGTFTIPITPSVTGRYVRIVRNTTTYTLAIPEVEVYGKATRLDTAGGGAPPQNVPLQVWFTPPAMRVYKCTLSGCNTEDFNTGEALTLPPASAIEFHANKELKGVSLQARLLVGTLPTPTVATEWRRYFNADPVSKKSFKFAGGNALPSSTFETPPLITIAPDGDQIINPIICANGITTPKIVPWVPCRIPALGGDKEQNVAEPIVFAEGLTVTPEKPIKIGFEDALLPKSGIALGGTAVRILIEAVYKEKPVDPYKKVQFPLDFVIK